MTMQKLRTPTGFIEMMLSRGSTTITILSLLALLAATISPASAHEEAVLKSPQSAVAIRERLALNGSDFTKGGIYRLRLIGALREYELRSATADSAGRFSLEVEIPSSVRPGTYKVVAIAADGDSVASLDITVTEPVSRTVSEAEHQLATEAGAQHMAAMEEGARAEELPIQRSRRGAEWGVIGLLIGLAAGLGVSLIRLT